MQNGASPAPALSSGKRKKSRKSGVDSTAAADTHGLATSNGPSHGGTAAVSRSTDAPSLVALSADVVAVVGWEAAAGTEGSAHTASTSGRLRAVVVDTQYGTVQAVHRCVRVCPCKSATICRSRRARQRRRCWHSCTSALSDSCYH